MTADWPILRQSKRCKCHVADVNISMVSRIFDYPRELNSFSINLRSPTFFEITRKTWRAESSMEENVDATRTSCARGKNREYTSPILVLVFVAISDKNFLRYILVLKFRVLLWYYESSFTLMSYNKREISMLFCSLQRVVSMN